MFYPPGAPKKSQLSRKLWPLSQTTLGINLSRPSLRVRLKGLSMMLLSGALGAVCFTYLASQRWRALDGEAVLFTVTYTQWTTLGITVAKLGLDTYLFAIMTGDPGIRINLTSFTLRYSAPISLVFGLVLIPLFGPLPALLLSLTVLSESASVLLSAQMTALRLYSFPAAASLLKYPTFFVFLLLLSYVMPLHAPQVASALCVGSILRFAYLATRRLPAGERELKYKPTFWVAVHHPLNLVLFKADQLILPLFGAGIASLQIQQYTYLTKWPELVSGLATTVGIVFFPSLYSTVRDLGWSVLRHNWSKSLLAAYAAGSCATTFAYCFGFNGAPPINLTLPFGLSIALLLPVNLATYALLRDSRLRGLIRNLLLSLTCGLLVCGAAVYTGSAIILSFVVPIQLVVFLTLFVSISPGAPTYSYGRPDTSTA